MTPTMTACASEKSLGLRLPHVYVPASDRFARLMVRVDKFGCVDEVTDILGTAGHREISG